jgi:hypothetical protein
MHKSYPLYDFPVSRFNKNPQIENPLYLVLFFSRKNCKDCLRVFKSLERFTLPFIVYGIVPDGELKDEAGFRNETGVAFQLLGVEGFKKFAPFYGLLLMGVSAKGRIFFLIPGVPGQEKILDFLEAFYIKAYPMLSM